jgi:RimJ/RimL family protein N-acetyltransferase
MDFISLETPRLFIRPFRDNDLEALVAYRSDPEIEKYQMWQNYNHNQAKDLISSNKHHDFNQGGRFQLALEYKQNLTLIGDLYLRIDEDEKRLGEIGYTLSRPYQKQGLASEAVAALLVYCFETLKMHRLSATADPRNIPSLTLLERLGFRREGYFVKSLWFKGEWADDVTYGLLAEEFGKNKEVEYRR